MKRGPCRFRIRAHECGWHVYDGTSLSVCAPTWTRAVAWADYVQHAAHRPRPDLVRHTTRTILFVDEA